MMPLKFTKEQKAQMVSLVQQYFRQERNEELGGLAAEFLVDFMIQQIGPLIYNQAIDVLQALLIQKMATLEEDVYALKLPIKMNVHKDLNP